MCDIQEFNIQASKVNLNSAFDLIKLEKKKESRCSWNEMIIIKQYMMFDLMRRNIMHFFPVRAEENFSQFVHTLGG